MVKETESDDVALDRLKRNPEEVQHIVENASVQLSIDRVYPDLSACDGNVTTGVENPAPERCETCNANCCGNERCKHSQTKYQQTSPVKEKDGDLRPSCSNNKKKSLLMRKSTTLLLSGFCMLGVTGISMADIATDILTAREYYQSGRYTAFILSLVFLIIPPILLTAGIIRRQDDNIQNTTTQTMSCCYKFFIVILNVPLKLYMIWLQLVFSYRCFRKFHRWQKSRCVTQEKTLMSGSLSHFITELTLYKLWNSIFESMPQLLLTIHVIMTAPDILATSQGYLLIASSVFSFGSLCVGTIFYAVKSKEAESQPRNAQRNSQSQTLRAKSTALGIPQIMLMSIYTVCFLGTRAASLSYFIVFFEWFAIIVPGLHWIVVFIFFAYRRYVNQKNTMHHYRMTTYQRRSSSFVYVFVHSVMSVFIHIKPECEEVLDQPRYYKIFYYLFYTIENCIMMLTPLVVKGLPDFLLMDGTSLITDDDLEKYQYYPVMYCVLGAMALGGFTCALYHVMVHKSAAFTREQVFGPCCKCCYGPGGFLCFSCCCFCCMEKDEAKVFITCKNIQTHDIYKTSLKDVNRWKQTTESKLLNKKPLRAWKVLHNEHKNSKRKDAEAEIENNTPEASAHVIEQQDPSCPYTMRRSGLHILSDPKGNLFYAPIADIKFKVISIS